MTLATHEGFPCYEEDGFRILLLNYSDPDRLNLARSAARYRNMSDIDNIERPLQIIRRGDTPEILKGESARFEFHGVSKEVYDHLVTYRLMNMRVAGGNRICRSTDYVLPSDLMKDASHVERCIATSMTSYHELLDAGESRQVARSAMPVAAVLNPFILDFSFLLLAQSVFSQRIWDVGAQGNTVKVVRGMWELVRSQDAELWDTLYTEFGPTKVDFDQIRRRLTRKKNRVTVGDFVRELGYGKPLHEIMSLDLLESLLRLYSHKKSNF